MCSVHRIVLSIENLLVPVFKDVQHEIIFLSKSQPGGVGMAEWWEHSLPTNVARVRFPVSALYVGWVCSWFSSLLRGFFSRYSGFPPSLKTSICKFQFDLETVEGFEPMTSVNPQIPFKPGFFCQAFFSQLLKLRTNCEDLSSIWSFIRSSKYMFHIFTFKNFFIEYSDYR